MKRFLKASSWMTLLLTLAAVCAFAAEPSAEVRKGIMAAKEKWKTATMAADRAALETLLTSDLSYTHSSSTTQTKEEFIADVTKGTTTYKSMEFQDVKMRQYGPVVIVTNRAAITSVQTGTSNLYITEVWTQQGDRWLLASRQATKLP